MNEKAIFSKCARRLIPFIMLLYVVNYIDRVNVAVAALTMNQDVRLSDSVYGAGGGLFFVGYLLFQAPANLILERMGARRFVFLILLIWGAVSAANALIEGPLTYYAFRFFLGVAEAGFFPGMLLYLTYWFPQSYRSRFIAMFMAAIPLANIVGNPLSTTILGMNGIAGLHGWQWMFLIEGLPAMLFAFAALKFLPDRPAKAPWLNLEEKNFIATKLAAEDISEQRDIWAVLYDPRVYAIGLILLGNQIALYGIQLWLPLIVHGMGFSVFATGFVSALPWVAGMAAMIVWGRRSDLKGERVRHIALPLVLAAASLIVAGLAHSYLVVLVALGVALVGTLAYNGPFFSLPSTFLAGTAVAGGIGLINSIGSFGRVIGPAAVGVLKQQSGNYSSGMMAMALALILSAVIVLILGRTMTTRKLRAA